jgi:hypothetical protein
MKNKKLKIKYKKHKFKNEKIPNSKLQITNKSQYQNSKFKTRLHMVITS